MTTDSSGSTQLKFLPWRSEGACIYNSNGLIVAEVQQPSRSACLVSYPRASEYAELIVAAVNKVYHDGI